MLVNISAYSFLFGSFLTELR